MLFSYDAAGQVQAVDFNGTYYYYLRNGQGDIVKLIDGNRNTVVEYAYDSWGKKLSCTGTLATSLGALNPFRYRGYVYDEETQWYYLKSRYYDPETCRFISADVLLSTGQGVLGYNCYAYCLCNPIHRKDDNGSIPVYSVLMTDSGGTGGGSQDIQFVDNQHDSNIENKKFGLFGTIGDNGCMLIALYNVLCAANKMKYSFEQYRYLSQFSPMHIGGAFRWRPALS